MLRSLDTSTMDASASKLQFLTSSQLFIGSKSFVFFLKSVSDQSIHKRRRILDSRRNLNAKVYFLHYMLLVRHFYPKRLTYSILWTIPTGAIWGEVSQGHNDTLTAVGFEPWSQHQHSSPLRHTPPSFGKQTRLVCRYRNHTIHIINTFITKGKQTQWMNCLWIDYINHISVIKAFKILI